MIGQTISHYKILEKLGEGGMGVVYKAEDTKLRRNVALKFLPSELTSDQGAKERFIHEAQAASAFDHPNICTIHEINETNDGSSFIAMACYEGETLKERIKHGQLEIKDAIDIALQVAKGLTRAHEAGIVHRDIKPANIMLTNRGEVKIVDFGLAKLAGLTKLTRTGATIGTAAYMSPEQARGDLVDHRTDIWSLGVVLYEMLAGKSPFKGEFEAALIYEIVNVNLRPIHELRPDVPDALEQIIEQTMRKDVSQRYQTTEELLADLQELRKSIESGMEVEKFRRRRVSRIIKRSSIFAGASIVLIAVVLLILSRVGKVTASEVPSIGILYLKNLGTSDDEQYTYGITQDVIVDVAKAGLVRVAPMKDILSIQESKLPADQIAQKLRVKYLLDGTFKREGGFFRLTAQIIEAATGTTVWADRLQFPVNEASALQGKLVGAIIGALNLTTTPALIKEITGTKTTNPEAYEYYLRASYLWKKSKNQDDRTVAQDMFKKAIALDSTFISARISLGSMYEIQGEYTKAETVYTAAARIAQSTRDRSGEANCLTRLGVVRWSLSDNPRARDYYSRSQQIYQELGDRSGECAILNNNGALSTTEGDNAKALEYYGQALEIVRALKDTVEESRVLNNMGGSKAILGDYSAALDLFSRCLTMKQQLNQRRGEGIALGNIANVYRDLGDYDHALQNYTKGLSIHREIRNRPYEASTLIDVGDLYSAQGQIDSARTCYERASAIAQSMGDQLYAAAATMSIGKLNLDQHQYQHAFDSLAKAIAVFTHVDEKSLRVLASAWSVHAEVHLLNRQRIEVRIHQVEELFSTTPQGAIFIPTAWSMYQTFTLLGDTSKAYLYLDKAFREVNTRSDKITDRDLRQSYLTNVKENREIVAAWNNYQANKK